MTQRISRRDMKRNELAETVGKTVGYVTEHKKGVTEGVAIVAGLAVIVAGLFGYRAWAARSAGQNLSRGLAVLSTPLKSEQPSAAKTFGTAAERQAEADTFLRKAASHGSTGPGRAAQGHPRGERNREARRGGRDFREGRAQGQVRNRGGRRNRCREGSCLAGQIRRGHRAPEARDRISVVGRAQGRPALHARPDLRSQRLRRRRLARRTSVCSPTIRTRLTARTPGRRFRCRSLRPRRSGRVGRAGGHLLRPPLRQSPHDPAHRSRGRRFEGTAPRVRRGPRAERGRRHRGGRALASLAGLFEAEFEPGPDFEVVVVDDRSTDGTGEILVPVWPRSILASWSFRASEPPEGWLGKPHALFQGALPGHGRTDSVRRRGRHIRADRRHRCGRDAGAGEARLSRALSQARDGGLLGEHPPAVSRRVLLFRPLVLDQLRRAAPVRRGRGSRNARPNVGVQGRRRARSASCIDHRRPRSRDPRAAGGRSVPHGHGRRPRPHPDVPRISRGLRRFHEEHRVRLRGRLRSVPRGVHALHAPRVVAAGRRPPRRRSRRGRAAERCRPGRRGFRGDRAGASRPRFLPEVPAVDVADAAPDRRGLGSDHGALFCLALPAPPCPLAGPNLRRRGTPASEVRPLARRARPAL